MGTKYWHSDGCSTSSRSAVTTDTFSIEGEYECTWGGDEAATDEVKDWVVTHNLGEMLTDNEVNEMVSEADVDGNCQIYHRDSAEEVFEVIDDDGNGFSE